MEKGPLDSASRHELMICGYMLLPLLTVLDAIHPITLCWQFVY